MATRVRISYGRTIQSAPYESIRLDVAIEKDVPENETIKDAVDKSVAQLQVYVKNKLIETLRQEEAERKTN